MFSPNYPLNDEAITGEGDFWEETLVCFDSYIINVGIQDPLVKFIETRKITYTAGAVCKTL